MARLTTRESPKGFWPHPDEEYFHKLQTPPWKVPKERKSRGSQSRFNRIEPNKTVGGEITTHNRFSPLTMDLCTDASVHNIYEDIDEENSGVRSYTPSGHQPRIRNPARQESIFVNSNDISFISDKNENVYLRDNDYNNVMYNFNKNNYAGYYPNFITPIMLPNKNFNYNNIQNNVECHQNQTNDKFLNYFKHTNNMVCGTPQIIKAHSLEGGRGRYNSHVIKAHNMKSKMGREYPPAIKAHSLEGDGKVRNRDITP